MKTKIEATTALIRFEGWMPPREHGLLPSIKCNWDGRMLQLFTDNLEQGEADMKHLSAILNFHDELVGALEEMTAQITSTEYCGCCGSNHEKSGHEDGCTVPQACAALQWVKGGE